MTESWWPEALVFWHWWILAVVCLGLELVAPGVFFLWVGMAAGAVGLAVMMVPSLGWEWQALAFAALSLLSTVLARRLWRPGAVTSDQPLLNRRAFRHVGSMVTLTSDLEDGRGRVKVGDGEWAAVADTQSLRLPRGSHVRVTGVRDGLLVIAPPEAAGPASDATPPHADQTAQHEK
ncbi:NfeD family protein [Roseospira visakhapatnamensis]|uniref:NfeD-like C-terminal domain-containing protein n=1 Tax=Roseospira visakhapatnamensis TaxID=390880 RepID=A0A7W6RD08_9PROT|nr:NfeD family protein [Roseospira visakhapatnamensis]MBB4265801.1 hypothetical protein [Roseospira visakhapatnamensis]